MACEEQLLTVCVALLYHGIQCVAEVHVVMADLRWAGTFWMTLLRNLGEPKGSNTHSMNHDLSYTDAAFVDSYIYSSSKHDSSSTELLP